VKKRIVKMMAVRVMVDGNMMISFWMMGALLLGLHDDGGSGGVVVVCSWDRGRAWYFQFLMKCIFVWTFCDQSVDLIILVFFLDK
jgi:hypothetical protein